MKVHGKGLWTMSLEEHRDHCRRPKAAEERHSWSAWLPGTAVTPSARSGLTVGEHPGRDRTPLFPPSLGLPA